MTWWDLALIEKTVTRQFVVSHLQPNDVENLDKAPGFGDGLTDGTYWEWIESKAKRIFLILVEIGLPDQIFGVVDHSWDDDDLPLSLNDVERLTATKDHKLNWRFWDRQFYYVLREIEEGVHMVYEDDEVVPIDIVDKKQATTLSQSRQVDRVVLPNRPNRSFCRWRLPAGSVPNGMSQVEFLREIRSTRKFRNEHIISYYASYTHLEFIYVLLTTTSEHGLKTVLTNTPASFKALSKQDQQTHILNWIHCLADALCYLHSKGRCHGNIKLSSVVFDTSYRALFADMTNSSFDALTTSSDKTAFNKESYDYAAPEQWFRPTSNNVFVGRSPSNSSTSAATGNYTFSISRGGGDHSTFQSPTPHLNAQAADIFSFGCIVLELISLLLKRTTKTFAAHRGAKHKLAGRGGAPSDTSFHKNIGQVESWMAGLAKDASKKDDHIFRGVAPMLQIVARMLSVSPQDRPTARTVEQQMYRVITIHCGIMEPHCVHQYEGSDIGLRNLKIKDHESSPILISTKQHSSGNRAFTGIFSSRKNRNSGYTE